MNGKRNVECRREASIAGGVFWHGSAVAFEVGQLPIMSGGTSAAEHPYPDSPAAMQRSSGCPGPRAFSSRQAMGRLTAVLGWRNLADRGFIRHATSW